MLKNYRHYNYLSCSMAMILTENLRYAAIVSGA
jgi:hypothetical protein